MLDARARAIIEAEVDTLVIHMDDRSTDFLTAIYAGKGYPVINGTVSAREMEQAVKQHARVFMLGHGGPQGLFTRGVAMDDSFGPLLAQKKDSLYIWCNADSYAQRNKLDGLVSGMFISEVMEASIFGIRATQEQVDKSNAAFSAAVRSILDSGSARSTVREKYCDPTCQVTTFNNERLYIFNNGVPTPALHASSAAHPRPVQVWEPRHREPQEEIDFEKAAGEVAREINDIIDNGTDPGIAARNIAFRFKLPRVAEDELFFELRNVGKMPPVEAREMLGDIVDWVLEVVEFYV